MCDEVDRVSSSCSYSRLASVFPGLPFSLLLTRQRQKMCDEAVQKNEAHAPSSVFFPNADTTDGRIFTEDERIQRAPAHSSYAAKRAGLGQTNRECRRDRINKRPIIPQSSGNVCGE